MEEKIKKERIFVELIGSRCVCDGELEEETCQAIGEDGIAKITKAIRCSFCGVAHSSPQTNGKP